ncbi:MAG: hypothetical protein HZB46_08145 [Solirubrobacterales bacterium]|nr:hypothetical protein [Solirubrobacterales bacterium]
MALGTRRTLALAIAALGTTAAVIVTEVARVRRHGQAEHLPEALAETVEVAVAGYRGGSTRENALLNLLTATSFTFALARLSTFTIRRRGTLGPFRNLVLRDRHVHHFVPGILLAFLAGGASIVKRDETVDPLLAVPFGVGVGLTLDESALLLHLDDVYWSEEGIVSVQITAIALLMLSGLALGLRVLRRGEAEVLPG